MSAEVWHRPLWYCADCGEGYDGDSDLTSEVEADARCHDEMNHEGSNDERG